MGAEIKTATFLALLDATVQPGGRFQFPGLMGYGHVMAAIIMTAGVIFVGYGDVGARYTQRL
jgi:hypothetical protein